VIDWINPEQLAAQLLRTAYGLTDLPANLELP
jgi:hypothetical protein